MAIVPKYTSRQRESLAQNMDFLEPARTANTLSQGINSVAQSTGQMAQAQARIDQAELVINQKLEAHKEKQEVQAAELSFLEKSKEAMFKAKTEFADNPEGATQYLQEQKNSISQELLNSITTTRGRDAFNNQMQRNFISMDFEVKDWQVKQTIQNTQATNIKIADQASTSAYDLASQGGGLTGLNQYVTNITLASEASSEVLTPKQRQDYLMNGQREVVLNYAQGLLDNNNIAETRKLLKSDEHRDMLGAKGISQVHRALQAKIKQNEERANKLKTKKNKEPWFGVGKEAGFIPFDPVNDPDGNQLRSGLMIRNEYRNGLPQEQRKAMPFLRPEETKVFKAYVDQLRPEQAAGFLEWFDVNTPSQDQVAIGQSIYRNTSDVAMAVGVTIASDAPRAAEMMITGKRWFDVQDQYRGKDSTPRTGKSTFLSPSSKQFMDAFERYYNPTTIVSPEQRLMAREAAFYHYVGVKSTGREPFQDELDEAQFKRSMETVIGPVGQYQGQDIVMFRNSNTGEFVDDVTIAEAMSYVTPELLEQVQGSRPVTNLGEDSGFQKFTKASLATGLGYGRIKLRNGFGEGQYYLVTDDGRAMLDSKTGQPFQIDMKKIVESNELIEKQAEYKRALRQSILTGGPMAGPKL